jgi:hypothetical protein
MQRRLGELGVRTVIHHTPREERRGEVAFLAALLRSIPEAELKPNDYIVAASHLDNYVNIDELLTALEDNNLLPRNSKKRCITALEDLRQRTTKIKVALVPEDVTFDFVVERGSVTYYWEFHEIQHRRLTLKKPSPVYSPSNEAFRVPRGLQRLVRDVWRIQNFTPYTIVWWDWFYANQVDYTPTLQDGLQEYAMKGKFTLRQLISL